MGSQLGATGLIQLINTNPFYRENLRLGMANRNEPKYTLDLLQSEYTGLW